VQAVVNGEPRRLSDVAGNASGSAAETPLDTAANRAATPDSLRRALRGDLETVVAKAVKKKPEERYESVGAFADDLRRYLDGEPVRARPDSFAYRAAKFVRRHARGVAAAAAFSLLLAALVGYYTARLAAERDVALLQAAKATQVSNLLTGLLTGADPYATEHGPELTVRALLDKGASRIEKELVGQPELQAVMLTVMGRVYQRLGALDRAQGLLERGLAAGRSAFGANDPHVAETLNDLGVVLDEKGDFAAAQRLLENALELRRRLLGPEHREVAVTMVELGRAYGDQGLDAKAEPLFREALAIRRKALGENDHETATSENELGLLLWRKGDLDGAEALFRRCLATDRKTTGDASPDVATALNNLALISMTRGDFAGAEPRLREALAIRRATLGARHPDLVPTLNNLATVLKEERRYDEAASTIEEALAIGRPALGDSHPLIAICWVTKAEIELARSDAAVAEPLLRRALAIQEATYRTRDWRMGLTESLLGEALTALRRYPEAERALVAARSILRDVPGREGEVAAANRARMVALDKARRASVR
jgi:tetratricopeptide (TPR) repeat protein